MLINLFDDNGITAPVVKGEVLQADINYIEKQKEFDGITIFTDNYLNQIDVVDSVKSRLKLLWLVEPKVISPNIYNGLNYDHFDLVLTHDKDLIRKGAKFVPVGGCWIPKASRKIHNKTKEVSIIASSKRQTAGHKLRHEVCRNFDIDKFGNGYKYIPTKDIALNDYMFSIAIENCSVFGYFTEKIIDCFATGTIPVYSGCINISNYFNPKGIIQFNSVEDLKSIGDLICEEYYQSKFEAIKENFELAKQYYPIENWLFKNIIKDLCLL